MIFFTVLRVFLVKKHAAFKWKDAISGFPVSPGSAEALVRWGGKTNYTLIAYFLGNICDKNCRNRTMYVKIIASQSGMFFFETQCTCSSAEGSVFGAISLWFFVCVWDISGTAERICTKFRGKTCLVPHSEEFEGQGRRSRSKSGTKSGIFRPFRRPVCGLCLVKYL